MIIKFITVYAATLIEKYGTKGASIALGFNPEVDYYLIDGTATLSTSLAINADSTPNYGVGACFTFRYTADVTLNGNTFNIFGKNIPARLSDKDMIILCTYNGTSWDVIFLPSLFDSLDVIATGNIEDDAITSAKIAAGAVDSTEIAAAAVVSAKIADSNVTVEKLEDEAKETVISIPKIFDYSAKTTFKVPVPIKCELVRIVFVVSETAIGATNDATMSISGDSAGSIFSGSIVANASAAVGSKITLTPAGTTNLVQGEILSFTPDGSQTTGKIVAAAAIMRLAD